MVNIREHLVQRVILCALFCAALLLPALAARAESFDTPLHERTVELGRTQNGQSKLTCDYFASFMVKQLDQGEEGASWIAIVPARAGHLPVCTQSHAATEKVIPGHDWCGYFQGAKQDYVFLNACNAYNGGMDFAVYDARTGTRIFQDTAVDSDAEGPHFSRAPDGKLTLLYSRIAVFACTLPKEQAACWTQIEGKLGLDNVPAPVCISYEKQMSGSVVAYPVEVPLSSTPDLRTPQAHPVAGQIRCWPPE